MKTDIWMPLYINDYLGDTMDLDAEGHGIYILLLMVLWKKGNLPSDKRRLMRIARTQDNELLDEILEDYFYLTEEGYSQKRAEEEKAKADKNREIARENGRKGGRPKTQKKPTGYENDNPQETHGLTHGEPNAEAKPNPEKSSSPSPSPSPLSSTPEEEKRGKRTSRFTPPSVEEVQAYCQERNNRVDPVRFVNFYGAKGWMIGKNKMKNWKQAVITWESSDRDKKPDQYNLGTAPIPGFGG